MLAKVWEDHKHRIRHPCAIQRKLDGTRAIFKDGKLWSRTRKPISSMAHIIKAIEECGLSHLVLDGELYHPTKKFEEIISAIRSEKELHKEVEDIEYHIYDVVSTDEDFRTRFAEAQLNWKMSNRKIVIVPTVFVNTEKEIMDLHAFHLEQGFEGTMVRNVDFDYQHKRTHDLLKLKTFQDAEFKIVDVEQGRGKLLDHAGAFVCVSEEGHNFRVKMEGELATLKKYWENSKDYIGKWVTVKFQGYTSANKVPRFPVGLRIREDYDL